MESKNTNFIEYFKEKGYEENRWLKRYIYFIEKFKLNKYESFKTEKHHILPASIFPEFKDLNKYKWNKAILSYRAHIISHYILAKAIGGNIIENYRKNLSLNRKNKINVYDTKDLLYKVISNIDFNPEIHFGWNKGRKEIGIKISNSLNKIEVVIYQNYDQRFIKKFLKENGYPSLFRLKKGILGFEFRKELKS